MVDRSPPEQYPEDFLVEAREIVQGISDDLLALEERSSSGVTDPAILQRIFRAAHSLKGLAGMFGATSVSTLAHSLEDLLDALRLGRERISRDLLDLLFEVPGTLESLLAGAPAEETAAELAGRLRHMAGPGSSAPLPPPPFELPREVLDVLTEYEVFRLHEAARRGRFLCGIRREFPIEDLERGLEALREELSRAGEVVSAVPTGGGAPDSVAFEVLVASDLPPLELASAIGHPVEELPRNAPPPLPVAPITAPEPSTPSRGTVRVEIARLDAIMNTVGELGVTRVTLARFAERLQMEPGLAGWGLELVREVRTLERRLALLREGVMEVRLVPLAPLFARMARVVRNLAREADKEVVLTSTGGDTRIDKLLVEHITDPLIQILRNALDHGIEPAPVRLECGKPLRGQILLDALSDGNQVLIRVRDDGAGIDLAQVRQVAVARRLVDAAAASAMSDREALALLFVPGFTTRPEVSEISGRGVGLDVAKTNIARLSGSIEVETAKGTGTRFTLRLPVTLAILPALLVRAAGETLALPVSAVTEIAGPSQARWTADTLTLRGEQLPCVDLAARLGFRQDHGGELAVLVSAPERAVALLVDEVVGQQEVVVKPLGKLVGEVHGVAGVAELGGGDLVLVLDLPGLVTPGMAP